MRFSLRAMLVGIVVISIPLAVHTQSVRSQRAAAEVIRSSGQGGVIYDDDVWDSPKFVKRSRYPHWLRSMLGEDFFHSVVAASITDANLLAEIRHFPRIRDIYVFDSKTSDSQLQHIAKLRHLRRVIVVGTSQPARVVDEYGRWGTDDNQLKTQLSDRSLALLGTLPSLETVNIYGSGMTSAGLKSLAQAENLQSVTIGNFAGNFRSSDASFFRRTGNVTYLILSKDVDEQPIASW